jgi:hypothetical protein
VRDKPFTWVLAFVVATAATPAALAQGAQTAAVARQTGSCGRTINVLFWPKGHPAIPSIDFPRIPTPHLEVYRGSRVVDDFTGFLSWVTAGPVPGIGLGSPSTMGACLSFDDPGQLVKPAKTVTATARLVCRFPADISIDTDELGETSQRIRILLSDKRIAVEATVRSSDSRMTYAPRYCARKQPLRPSQRLVHDIRAALLRPQAAAAT